MRIALLPSAYAPAVGGVEELTAWLAAELERAGDESEVWTIRYPDDLPTEERINDIQVRRFAFPLPRLAPKSLARAPYDAWTAARTLLPIARDFRPDILHVQCFSANGVYATWLAKRLRVPLVVTLQGETVMDDTDIYERSVTLKTSLRIALRRANAVTACSQFVLDDAVKRFGLPPRKGTVIPNGVDIEAGSDLQNIDVPFDRFIFCVGRVVAKKGFDLMLDAFARIAEANPDVGLVIGGDGQARPGLMRQAAAAGLADRVSFPGTLTRGQVASAMATAEVFVLPSRIEPFGIVVLEALRAGCPVVVSGLGGATEIVRDGIDGIVVDPSTEALGESVERILTDRELSDRLRAAGPGRAAEFTWQSIVSRYQSVYRQLAA